MTIQDERQPVVYGAPPWPPYRDEIQSTIGAELRTRYAVPHEVPHRLLVILMQLKELDGELRRQSRPAPKKSRRRVSPPRHARAPTDS